ncbi:hypothetical protein [Heliomarina baculiformis]|uniref:hypothetical protein n=1 Tax=Heliomarina baculiformis TaxID=2872036 RepID=UPI001EE273D4|nr:hypothetical protein [Heliomarina baculiformis]
MNATLRDITEAICAVDRLDKSECKRVYERARMLRDKGLLKTSTPPSQGRAASFSEADTAAAVTAIRASLSGSGWNLIGAILSELRAIDNTNGRPEFERHIEAIKAGKPIWARVDVIVNPEFVEVGLPGEVNAKMGTLAAIGVTDDPKNTAQTTHQITLWPVTLIAKPVLDHIKSVAL